MEKFDWNEIVVTNDANIANGQVKDRMILVTGEKGDKGDDGRGILQVQKTSSTATYDVYTIYYSDGTKSTFSIDLRTGDNTNTNKIYMYSVNEAEGSDDNIGSYDSPFKTLRKAIEAVPVGRIGTITIQSAGNYGPNVTIHNRILAISITADDVNLGNLNIGRSNVTIEAYNHPFTTSTITAENSKIIISGDNPQMLIENYASEALKLDNSEFINKGTTKFKMMNSASRYGIVANNQSRVSVDRLEFIEGPYTVGLNANSGSVIAYNFMSGDVLQREVSNLGGFIYSITPGLPHTYYVDGENGSNENTGKAQNSPFKTIKQAIDLIPNNTESTIVLLGGFCENVAIENKKIIFDVQSNTATVGRITASNSEILCTEKLNVVTDNQNAITLNNTRFSAINGIAIEMTNESSRYAITANDMSVVYLNDIEFKGIVTTALTAQTGSIIRYNSMSGDDTIANREVCYTGGIIYHDVPNNLTFFVDGENGNNNNTGLSANSPFKSLQYAINQIPDNCYSTIVLLDGNCGSATIEKKRINFDISNNQVVFGKITLNNSDVIVNGDIKIETSEENGIILNHSDIHISNNIEFEMTNESGRYAITANDLSRANFRNITFTGEVTTGIIAQTGSIVCYLSMSGNDTIVNREICYTGGFIYRLTPGISHTYYVDGTNGSDNNAGISSDSPFKTLQYAVNQIPDNCYSVINLLNGNCGDTSLIDKLVTLNVDNENVIVGDLTLNRSNVDINNENQLLVVGAIEATESTLSYVDEIKIITDKERGISLINSRFYAKGAITFEMTNTSNRNAIYARYASHAYFSRIHCHGDMTTVIYSGNGSIVGYMSLDGDGRIGNEEVKEYGGRIYSGSQDEAGSKIIAEDFDNSKNYHIDDYVIYNNDLYRFIADHDAGDWNRNHATKIYATDEFIRLRNPQDGKLYARRNDEWEEIVTTVDAPITTSTTDNTAYCFEGTKDDESAEIIVELEPNNIRYPDHFLKHKMIKYYASDSKNLIELYNKQNYDLPHTDTVGGVSVTTNPDGSFTLNGTASSAQELHIGYVKNCQTLNLRITGGVNNSSQEFFVVCEASPSGGSGGSDEGNGATFIGVTGKMPVWIRFSGEFQNATFYPMVRIASFGDDEFEEPITNNLEESSVLDISSYDIYGGYVNFKTGTIVKTWEYIPSYNGEEITDEWISFQGGALPQTGAEVVYKLATPIEYHFDPLAIPTYNDKTTIILYCADEEDAQYRPKIVYIKNSVMLDDYAKQTKALIDKKADKLLVARNFDATENYSVGDIVFYNESGKSKLYRFTVEHPAGDWNQSHVEETTIATELGNKTSGKNINSIVLSQSGAEYDTYRVTFSDATTLDFQIVKDGYTKQQIDDAFYTKQAVDNFLFNKADAIKEYGTRTVKGKEIYIPAGATVTDFKIYLEPFQTGEGEPSATNIQPIYETSEVEIQKKNIGGDWTDAISIIAAKYTYNGERTYGNIVDYINKKSYSSWALIPIYAGHQLPGRWVSDRDVYSDFAPTAQPSSGAQVAYEKATPESPEDLLYVDMKNYNFNRSEPYLLRAHYWHEYSQYDAEFVMEITYNANVPVDTKTYIDDKHDALREEMYSNLGTITTENTSDTHWMKLENTLSNQVIKKLQIEYKPSLTSIDWIEVDIKNRNLIQTQFGYSGVTWKGVTFTQNEDDSISFTGTPTQDIDLDIGYVTGMPVGQYYISGGINTNCYIYILGASNIKSTGNDTLFTANQFIGSLPLELHITNTGEEVSGTFFPMVRFKDDDGTYIKPVYKASLWERLGTELDRKPAYGFSYDFVTATLTETWKHIDSYNFEPNPFPRRWIADNYGSNGPYSGASVTYELVEPEVREEDNKYTNQHLVDGVTYLFANNSNIVISEVNAQIRIDDFVESSIAGKADKTEVYTKAQTDTLISNSKNIAIHVCASGEYDNTTYLPTIANPEENTFYLVPTGTGTDIFDEWIYINNAWEKFGSASVDLTQYITQSAMNTALASKQDVLTFDTTLIGGSTNPVTNGGVSTAIDSIDNIVNAVKTKINYIEGIVIGKVESEASYSGNNVVAVDFGTYINPSKSNLVLELKPFGMKYQYFNLVRFANKNIINLTGTGVTSDTNIYLSNDAKVTLKTTYNTDCSVTFTIPAISTYPNETLKSDINLSIDSKSESYKTGIDNVKNNNITFAGLSLKTTGSTPYIKVMYNSEISTGQTGRRYGDHYVTFKIEKDTPISEIDGVTIYPQLMFTDIQNTVWKKPETYINSNYYRDISSFNLYGLDIELSTGKVYKTWNLISNYDGRPLPGEWISSLDEYAEGTLPTNGARVFYKLETPIEQSSTISGFSNFPDSNIRYIFLAASNESNFSKNINVYMKNATPEQEDPVELVIDDVPTDGSNNPVKSNGVYDALALKQDALTFDSAPTANSTNPVTSGGVKTALDAKQNSLTFDTVPTAGSVNPVTSGGVKTALDEKQDALTFDTVPTADSTNPVTSGGVKTALDSKENTIIKTATGAIASFDDGVEAPAAHVVAKIEPVQAGSGDPSPDNVRPITGWTGVKVTRAGKNLFDISNLVNGHITAEGEFIYINSARTTDFIPVIDGKITASAIRLRTSTQNLLRLSLYDSEKKFVRRVLSNSSDAGVRTWCSINDNNISYIRLSIFPQTEDINTCQIEYGVNQTEFEEFSNSYSITFPSETGTVYGGELDVTTGVLTVNRKMIIFDGSENWISSGGGFYLTNISAIADVSRTIKPACNLLRWDEDVRKTMSNITEGFIAFSTSNYQINLKTSEFSTVNEFKNFISENNLQICCYLVTPITYQLTPIEITTLLGENHIWADTGDITIDYFRNKELADAIDNTIVDYQKQVINKPDSMITDNIELLSKASQNYEAGSLAIVQNQLIRVTQNIATGGAITIGSNAEAVDLETVIAEKAEKVLVAKLPFLSSASLYNDTADFHNAMPRGKDITAYLTDGSLWNRINGTNGYSLFEDLYVGDYLTAGGQQYMIVDFDYYIRTGNSHDLTAHHLVMMPVGNMSIPEGTVLYNTDSSAEVETLQLINTANYREYTGDSSVSVSYQETATVKKWNATIDAPNTHTTAGGYKYSRMRQVFMKAADTIVRSAFGADHVKPVDVLYPNPADAAASGTVSEGTWFINENWDDDLRKSICDLPNEVQIFGTMVFALREYEIGVDKWQFSLFRYSRRRANIRSGWWLRSVYKASIACSVSTNGNANNSSSSLALGVRPRFVLVG